jgi:hypothetical protein
MDVAAIPKKKHEKFLELRILWLMEVHSNL